MSKFTLILDASQIKTYLTCPLSWYLKYIVSEEVNGEQNMISVIPWGPAMNKGTYIHKLMDIYYSLRSADPNAPINAHAQTTVEFIEKAGTAKNLELDNKTVIFLNMRFLQYVNYYKRDFTVLKAPDGSAGVEVPFAKLLYENSQVKFIVEGRIDVLMAFQDPIKGWGDHKTQAQRKDLYGWKPQFLTYAWATGFHYGMVNYIGLQKEYQKNSTFRRDIIEFPQWKIDEWEKTLKDIFFNIYDGLNCKNQFEYFRNRRNLNSCSGAWESTPCSFCSLCKIEPWNAKLRDVIKSNKFQLVKAWTPWSLSK